LLNEASIPDSVYLKRMVAEEIKKNIFLING